MLGLAGFGEIEYVRLRYVASNLDHHGFEDFACGFGRFDMCEVASSYFRKNLFFSLVITKRMFFLIPKLKF